MRGPSERAQDLDTLLVGPVTQDLHEQVRVRRRKPIGEEVPCLDGHTRVLSSSDSATSGPERLWEPAYDADSQSRTGA